MHTPSRPLAALLLATCAPVSFVAAQDDRTFIDSFEAPIAASLCATAPVLAGDADADAVLDPPTETHAWRYAATAGEWLSLRVTANPDQAPERLDSVLTLYTADGSVQLARNDDDAFGGGLDSLLLYRADTAGTYCVTVEDYTTAHGFAPPADPVFDYVLTGAPLDFAAAGLNRDTEPNDNAAAAQVGTTGGFGGYESAFVAGAIDGGADVDVYRFTTGAQARFAAVEFAPQGIAGYGGSVGLNLVDVVATDGSSILARLDVALGARGIRIPVAGATAYHVVVRTPAGALGARPTYVLRWQTEPDAGQLEANNTGNGTAAGAEAASPFQGDSVVSHFVGGTFGTRGDLDFWSFAASAGDRIRVYCASRREGSGADDAHFRLYGDPAAAPLVQETESATSDVAWHSFAGASRPAVIATETRTYYLRTSASLLSATVFDRHYSCGMHVDAAGSY